MLLLAVAVVAIPSNAQTVKSPEQTVKDFYRWYIHELNADRQPRNERAKMNAAISARLQRWMSSKEGRNWDADYFIDAQDWEPKWENGISTAKPVIRGNNANVKATLSVPRGEYSGFGDHILRIKLVKEQGVWKIDRVNGR